ncbi:MAG: A/G-specific adenine glycosylase [Desulfatibacillaceae bacterium]
MSADALNREQAARMGRALVAWYEKHRRELPWRRDFSPYPVWVAEVMLQQTRVDTAGPYYERWMERFPDVAALAGADEDEVLRHFAGLGYYSRARNMLECARVVMAEYGGEFPGDKRALLGLPGIGPYTAAAVLAFAFDRDVAVVDANVERIVSRLYDVNAPIKTRAFGRFAEAAAHALLVPGRGRDFNQALMDLGSLACTPKNPRCNECPLARECLALANDTTAERPVRPEKPRIEAIDVSAAVVFHRGMVLVQKRPEKGLMAGLWEFPGGKLEPGETPEQAVVREMAEELELRVACGRKITTIRHSYTRFRVTLHVFECAMEPPGQVPVPHAATEIRWVRPADLAGLAFPAADKRLVEMLRAEAKDTCG